MPEIKDINKAAKRVKKAIKNNEKIVLFSDADLDGSTALLITEEAIKSAGGSAALCYFPDREIEGYGLSEVILKKLKKYTPGVLILMDCGIASFQEVKIARQMGFDVIVIDHHEILDNKAPSAFAVIDPKQKSDRYPFKFLASCGLCFKFAKALLGKNLSKNMENSLLELTALGTIADMMPQEEDNQIFIRKGLESLPNTLRPGLIAFQDIFDSINLPVREFAQKISSVLQITDFDGNLTQCYVLLSSRNLPRARKLAKKLASQNEKRRDLVRAITEEVIQKTTNSPIFVFEAGKDIPQVLTGSISSRVCSKFKVPAFVITIRDEISRGSVRAPKTINCVSALKQCSALLDGYGGHPQAAGFCLKNKNIKKFKQCLNNHFTNLPVLSSPAFGD